MYSGGYRPTQVRKYHRKVSYFVGDQTTADNSSHLLGVNATVYHRETNTLLSAGRDATVRHWKSDTIARTDQAHGDAVNDVAIVHAAQRLTYVTASSDYTTAMHTPDNRCEAGRHTDVVKKVRCHGELVYTGSLDSTVHMLSAARELDLVRKLAPEHAVTALGLSMDGGMISTGCVEGTMYLFDPRSNSETAFRSKPQAHESSVKDIAFMSNNTMISAGADGVVRVWDLRSFRYSVHAVLHTDAVFSLSPMTSSTFFSGARDGTVAVTNVASLVTSTVVVENNPIYHVNAATNAILYTTSCLSDINAYSVANLVSPDVAVAGGEELLGTGTHGSVSPSRIAIEINDLPVVEPMVKEDNRMYSSPLAQAVPFESKEQEQRWCGALRDKRPVRKTTNPDMVLRGSSGAAIQCQLLDDKRHVLCLDDTGHISLWNIIRRKKIADLEPGTSFEDAKKLTHVRTYAPSWCQVDCRWGTICVTLSQGQNSGDAYAANVTDWDYSNNVPLRKQPPLSIFAIHSKKRQAMRGSRPFNLGYQAILDLFEKPKEGEKFIIWSAASQGGDGCNCRRFLVSQHEDLDGTVLPSWVRAALEGNAPQMAAAKVVVEVIPASDKSLKPLPNASLQLDKMCSFADIATKIAKDLGVINKTPTRESVADAVKRSNGGVGFPEIPSSQGGAREAEERLQPDEFIEMLSYDEKAIIDPMMMVSTGVVLYKEPLKGTLQIKYRKNRHLP